MIISLKYREQLSGFLNVVGAELDNIIATLRTWSNVEHNDDGTHSPNVGNILQFMAGANIGAGQPVYVSAGADQTAPGQAYLADASAVSKSTQAAVVGLATISVSAGADVRVRDRGIFSGLVGLQAGKVYYLGTTPGSLTLTQPTNAVLIGLATSTTDLLILLRNPTQIAQQALVTWSGTTSGSQNLATGSVLPFTTVGTYAITVSTPMTVLVKASAGGGGGGTDANPGNGAGASGGGGGASHVAGLSVSLVPGKTYTAIVGAAGAAGTTATAGGVSSFVNTTDTITLLSLNGGGGGTDGAASPAVGAGGTVGAGAGGVAGGAGGQGGNTGNGQNGVAAASGCGGGGGGGGGNGSTNGGTGGNGVATGGTGGNSLGSNGGNNSGQAGGGGVGTPGDTIAGGGGGGGGAQVSGVTGSFGGGGGGGSFRSAAGGAGLPGALALVFVSAP